MNRILYIDFFNYFYSQFSVHKAMDENGEPLGGFIGAVDQIERVIYKFHPDRVVIVLDGPEAGFRRRSLFPDYKGRKARKPHIAKVQMGEEFVQVDNEEYQLKSAYSFLRKLPVTVVVVPFYEADDIIARLVLANPQYENIICSSDKDYLQLVSKNTSVWAWGKKTLYTPSEVVEHYKVLPENFPYFRSIIGDNSDKLPGVEGIGEITILKLIPELGTKSFSNFETFWEAIANLDAQMITETKTRNLLGTLKEKKDTAHLMYRLMKLDSDMLKLKAIEQLGSQIEQQQTPVFNTMDLKLHCIKHGLEKHFKYFDSWVRPFVALRKTIILNV